MKKNSFAKLTVFISALLVSSTLLSPLASAADGAASSAVPTVSVSTAISIPFSIIEKYAAAFPITLFTQPIPTASEAVPVQTEKPVQAAAPVQTVKAAPVVSLVQTAAAPAAAVKQTASQPTQTAAIDDPNMAYKQEIIRLVNVERENAGVADLKEMDALFAPADVRAKESAAQFSHTRPDGSRCFTVFAEFSLTYVDAGENLAGGFSSAADTVAAWMNSPKHKQNILDPDFKYIGIGYYQSADGKVYCSQLFYTPRTAA